MQEQEGVAIATPVPESVPSDTIDLDTYREQRDGKAPKPVEPPTTDQPAEAPTSEQEATTEPESATGDAEQQQEQQAAKQQGKGGFQRRIDKLTEERYRLEGEVRALREQLAVKPAGSEQQATQEDKPPVDTEFDNWNDYLQASVRYEAKKLLKAEKEADAQRLEAEAQRKKMDTFFERANEARNRHADYDDVISNPNLPVNAAMNEAILDSEFGPDMAYWLGTNPAKCIEIARMSPTAATREMLRLELQFAGKKQPSAATPQPKPTIVSAAPKPISPVTAGTVPQATVSPGKMDLEEYRRWRESGGGR